MMSAADASPIVVGVDLSDHSMSAIGWALAKTQPGSKIHLVHSYTPLMPIASPGFTYCPNDAEQKAWEKHQVEQYREFLARAEAKFKIKDKAVEVESHIAPGDPRHILPEYAAKVNADTVVVGSHGRGMLGRAFLGSVSSYLAHHCPLPTVIVKTETAAEGPSGK